MSFYLFLCPLLESQSHQQSFWTKCFNVCSVLFHITSRLLLISLLIHWCVVFKAIRNITQYHNQFIHVWSSLGTFPYVFCIILGTGVAADTAAGKIVELSKKNRELTADLQSEKNKARQLAKRVHDLEVQVRAFLIFLIFLPGLSFISKCVY